jgi:uncharacterized protein (TIGR02284 family)
MQIETPATLSNDTISVLQGLIQMNIDSHDGFREAADCAENVTIASLFRELAFQRSQQAAELQTLVALNRDRPQESGSVAAVLHRVWIDIRSALGGGTAAALIEAERGEDYIKSKYEEALINCAGSPVIDLLKGHYAAVKLSHERIRDLRDEFND